MKKRQRGRPRTKNEKPYDEQAKDFTWEVLRQQLFDIVSTSLEERAKPPKGQEWIDGYSIGVTDVLVGIRELIEYKILNINKTLVMGRIYRAQNSPDIWQDWPEESRKRMAEMGKALFEKAPEDYRKKYRPEDKVDQLKTIVSRLFVEQNTDHISTKELAGELNVGVDHILPILEEAKARHTIRDYGQHKGRIIFQRFPPH